MRLVPRRFRGFPAPLIHPLTPAIPPKLCSGLLTCREKIGKDVLRFNLNGTKSQTLNGMKISSISGFDPFGASPNLSATAAPFSLTSEKNAEIRIEYTFTK